MTVNTQKPIVIFRGDNTAAFDLRTITILLTGDLDLTNATARFDLLDFTKSWTTEEVATGELSIVFDSAQTKSFALGPQVGTLRLYDMSTGMPRQLTIVNKIPFFVTNRVCEIDSQSYEADVCVSGGDVIHIEFKVGAGAVEGKADKVKNATAGDLASLTVEGNLEDSGIPKTDVLRKSQMDSTPMVGSQNPVTSDGIKQAIDAATPSDYAQVKEQVQQNTTDISGIEAKIPAQASAQNQLADKAFVNSSIATNTANFLGTYDYVTDLGFPQPSSSADVSDAAIATALGSLTFPQTPTNNDYVFVQIDYTATTPADEFRRFKFNGTAWAYEYTLNNSSFTADQWAAINSGITSGDVAKLGALPTAQELATALGAKYVKPSTGIPKTDLSSGVQASLDKADTALQSAPVTSVNSKTGAVVLGASDVGAATSSQGAKADSAVQTITIAGTATVLSGPNVEFPVVAPNSDVSLIAAASAFDTWLMMQSYAPRASPAFTGTPTAPTPTSGDDSTKVATTAFVQDEVGGKANSAAIAPEFSSSSTYAVGDVVMHGGLRYKCSTAVSAAGEWNAANWTLEPVQTALGNITPGPDNTKLDSEAAAPDYDDEATYAEGEYVTYLGKLYYAKQAITTAEDWTAAHWQEDRLAPYIKTFTTAITALSQRGYVIDDNGQPVAVFPDGTVPQIDGYPLRYSIPASVALTATNDEATLVLADRAVTNATIATGFSTLNLTFPTAISGKVRDFYMRITVAAGESAPAMVLPQGITAETPDGSLPAIADGGTSAASTTEVYFSETSAGTFIVKAETVTTVASAA